MEVPFHSSGALSRAHYAIVRKVESAPSVQSADQHIFLEIKSIQAQLSHPKLALDKCKECLIILLYCYHTVTPGFLTADALDFAFPHAINLAEAGRNVEEKRLGYLFCSEIMPLHNELRLMLINTLRKDLESDDIPLICMALDNLIVSPNEDVIPAVQSHLHELLVHDHSQVRRRALFAMRALSACDRALLDRIHGSIIEGLQDQDYSVVKAALALAGEFPKDTSLSNAINELFKTEATYVNSDDHAIFNILKSFRSLEMMPSTISLIYVILRNACQDTAPSSASKAIIQAIFAALGQIKSSIIIELEKSRGLSSVQCIRHLLVSHNPNDIHLFLSCLEQIDASCWAGTSLEREPVLDSLEFERIMQLLEYPDEEISRKAIRVVNKVDPAILDAQISLLMKNRPDATERVAFVSRVLSIAFVRHASEGDRYAKQVLELISHLEHGVTPLPIFKDVIEIALNNAHNSEQSGFFTSFSDYLIEQLIDEGSTLGPTALVIATALLTEVAKSLPSPSRILSSLVSRLRTCSPLVQEPLLIAMIRLRAECNEVPANVVDIVNELSQSKQRATRLRCKQFLEFSQNKDGVIQIVENLQTSTLPDFLIALENYRPNKTSESVRSASPHSRSSSRSSRPTGALNYAAYARPEIPVPLKNSRMGSSPRKVLSNVESSILSNNSLTTPLSLTAGHLGLADSFNDLRITGEHYRPSASPQPKRAHSLTEVTRVDLINLESPFPVDTTVRHESTETLAIGEMDFEDLWESLQASCDLRGWCNMSIDSLTRRLQRVEGRHLRVVSADLPPFIGELKIEMVLNNERERLQRSSAVLLRLRESEEESCLWRLRCSEVGVGERIQSILNG